MVKRVIPLLAFLFVAHPLFGQQKYFHELKGMEDSTGTTHLFYQLHEDRLSQLNCNGTSQTYYSTLNNIYVYNTSSQTDKLKFLNYFEESCTGNDIRSTDDYTFYNKDPEKWIVLGSFGYVPGISDYKQNGLNFQIPIVIKANFQSFFDYYPERLLLSPGGDSLYVQFDDVTVPFPGNSDEWPEFDNFEMFLQYADTQQVAINIIAIHPAIDSLYFAESVNGKLYRSEHYSTDFQLSDSINNHYKLSFDANSFYIYSLVTVREGNTYVRRLLLSDQYGKADSWQMVSTPETNTRIEFIQTDPQQTGHLFLANSNNVYASFNFGAMFSLVFSTEDEITGIYKKPDSDILYVLTKKELLEVNTQTNATKTLREVPVSNEPEPVDIPKQATLFQNYPNPFNPTTVINYSIVEPGHITLSIYDRLGKKVQTLVDEFQQVGFHRATFNANGLASGIYYYQLIIGDRVFTRKMTLIK